MFRTKRMRIGLLALAILFLVDGVVIYQYRAQQEVLVASQVCSTTRAGDVPDLSSGLEAWTSDELDLELIANVPSVTGLTQIGDGRLLVTSQLGRLWLIDGGSAEIILDLSTEVSHGVEQGLLGVAAVDGLVLVSLVDNEDTLVVWSYETRTDGVPRGEPSIVLALHQPHEWHNGGHLEVGVDGSVYIGVGDGGGSGDPFGNGQDPDTLFGSIARFSPEHNLSVGPDGFGDGIEMVAFGLRNPWGFSFDTLTGDLWIGDVGQFCYEEVDVVPAGTSGPNFGWPVLEGSYLVTEPAPGDHQLPAFEYFREGGMCSIIGGTVYRGEALPDLYGKYVFADYCTGLLTALTLDGTSVVAVTDLGVQQDAITGITQGHDGELYILTFTDGVFLLRR